MKSARLLLAFVSPVVLSGGIYVVLSSEVVSPTAVMPDSNPVFTASRITTSETASLPKPTNIRQTDVGNDGQDFKTGGLEREIALLKAETSTLTQRLQELSTTVAQLSAQANWVTAANATVTQNPFDNGDIVKNPEIMETVLAQAREESDLHIAAIETLFKRESADTQWSAQTIDAIEQALASEELAATSIIDVDCRSTLCRVEVQHSDQRGLLGFQAKFSMRLGELLPSAMVDHIDHGDGSTSTIVYLARDGYGLPEVEPLQ